MNKARELQCWSELLEWALLKRSGMEFRAGPPIPCPLLQGGHPSSCRCSPRRGSKGSLEPRSFSWITSCPLSQSVPQTQSQLLCRNSFVHKPDRWSREPGSPSSGGSPSPSSSPLLTQPSWSEQGPVLALDDSFAVQVLPQSFQRTSVFWTMSVSFK